VKSKPHRLNRASESHQLKKVFVAFINQIAEKLGGGEFAVFLDNLSVHKTKDAKHLFVKFNIIEIVNVPYCPQSSVDHVTASVDYVPVLYFLNS
jgi:predicted signal transduction protein with EAL and GGDEF domain